MMKKQLLLIPLLFLWSFTYASWIPEMPMDIYWETNINWWTLEIYNWSNKLASYNVTDRKFGSTIATEEHLLLNQFDWNITFKFVKNWTIYNVGSIDSKCPTTFVSKSCEYDIIFEEPVVVQQSSAWGWRKIQEQKTIVKPTTVSTTDTKKSTQNLLHFSTNTADTLEEAYLYAYLNWITTKKSMEDAEMYWPLTRAAMAKMLSYYAMNVLGKEPDKSKVPNFDDVSTDLDLAYNNWIVRAYQLWIMWINVKNFRPYDLVTRAEFGTALSRLLFGIKDGDPYYEPHLNKLEQLWIISNTNPTLLELRWYVMLMLMRSSFIF